MDNILELTGISKDYGTFCLGPVDLQLPRGVVMGLVGANGAGKTTLMKLILGLIKPTGGTVRILGGTPEDNILRERIGVVFDELSLPGSLTSLQAGNIMAGIYKNWDATGYTALVKKLELPEKKSITEFSRGMKMKLGIAVALSHKAELLLLDEPTGGLDPIVRGEILDLFREFMQNENNSILISSHITSDLVKLADYITYIDKGKLLLTEDKDVFIEQYGVVKGHREELSGLDTSEWLGLREEPFGFAALVKDRDKVAAAHPQLVVDRADLDDIMLYLVGEARK